MVKIGMLRSNSESKSTEGEGISTFSLDIMSVIEDTVDWRYKDNWLIGIGFGISGIPIMSLRHRILNDRRR